MDHVWSPSGIHSYQCEWLNTVPFPGGDYRTRWQATTMACCLWSRLKKAVEKMTVMRSKLLGAVSGCCVTELESLRNCAFKCSFKLLTWFGSSEAACVTQKQVMGSMHIYCSTFVSLMNTNEMLTSIQVWTTPICQWQLRVVGFPWIAIEIIRSLRLW